MNRLIQRFFAEPNPRWGTIRSILGLIFLGAGLAVITNDRIAIGRVWLIIGMLWLTWGLGDCVPRRLRPVAASLRLVAVGCSIATIWFVMQL